MNIKLNFSIFIIPIRTVYYKLYKIFYVPTSLFSIFHIRVFNFDEVYSK